MKKLNKENVPEVFPKPDRFDAPDPKDNWPKHSFLIEEDEVYIGDWVHPENNDCRCLLGWTDLVFGHDDNLVGQVQSAISRRIYALTNGECFAITRFNDHLADKFVVAKIWNLTMNDLGYL